MSLIDTSYFIRDISIPNIDSAPNSVQGYIDMYEKEVLIKLLGYDLYKDFMAGLDEDPIPSKWINLRDGADFSFKFDGHTVSTRWEGLINESKRSLIAYYVYYKIRVDSVVNTSGIGDVVANAENSKKVSDVPNLVNAWNKMVKLYGYVQDRTRRLVGYEYAYPHAYQTFDRDSDTYLTYNDEPSAYNFLNAYRSVYSNWVFEPIKYMNSWDL